MKKCFLIIALTGILQAANAQEQLPREEALKLAFLAGLDLPQLQGTPIPTDVDLKNPIAVRDGDYGGLFLPEAKLTADSIAQAGDKVVPIGQLWLRGLTPMQNSRPVYSDQLRMAKVYLDGSEMRVPQCTLGIRKNSAGKLEMLVFGKTAQPVVTAPITTIETQSNQPVTLEAERDYESGTATVVLFGKYKTRLAFTELEY